MKKFSGYSLVELLIAIGMFGLICTSIIFFSVEVFSSTYNFQRKVNADIYREKIFREVSFIKHNSWGKILTNTSTSPMYIVQNVDDYEIVDGTFSFGDISYYITIENVNRDINGNISDVGINDPHTREVIIHFTWEDKLGRDVVYTTSFFVNDWNTYTWVQTTESEFDGGTFVDTLSTNNSGGEVQLQSVVYSDWCKPQNTSYSFDLPGQGIANTISADPGRAFVGTGSNASGLSFVRADITHSDPPTTSIHGSFDGYKVNDSYGVGNFAYLATDTNAKEVVILDISSVPYTEVGYFDSPGSSDAVSVVISGTNGFVSTGTNVYRFDLTSNNGGRSQIGNAVDIGGTVSYMTIDGNYLYVANSSTTQLKIIDFSNPTSMSIIGSATVDGSGGTGIYAKDDIAYLVTASNASKNELFLIDVSNKSGSRSVLGSADTNGMSPKSVTLVDTARVVVVGTNGNEYQVYKTENPSTPNMCGQLNIDTGVFDSAGVKLVGGDTYTYIVTGDSAGELKVIKGGAGGGGADGNGYMPSGEYISSILDTTSTTTSYLHFEWDEYIPNTSDLRFQIRSSESSDMSGSVYVGPDGTNSTYFTTSDYLPNGLNNKRYFQFKAYYTSDTVVTPILRSVTLNYAK